jgi:hypothetical protein
MDCHIFQKGKELEDSYRRISSLTFV